MAGDHQRRFEDIMNKLSQSASPSKKKPLPSRSDGIGRKKAELGIRVSPMESDNKQCRPWDRGDLIRRLATFKSMTWFGKPKAISAVNCARRGWINIEMDVISCEACGARLLFSTPSSWTLQQVEKAAAVFSLKLDNGHKVLCPWNNNACDEKLSLFPPTPPPALVDSFKERSSALLRFTALPIVSSSAVDYMKSPQLDHFLSQLSFLHVTLNNGINLVENARSKALEGASEDATSNMYYQAQKIISLCGWEPSLLPYVVDSEGQPSESSGEISGERKNRPMIHTSGASEDEGKIDSHLPLAEHQYDPASTVLDCRFCGARVGLWAFARVQRPLESFIVVSDPNEQNELASRCTDMVNSQEISRAESSGKDHQNIGSTSRERPVGLKLTIAGGPLPTKQNFRPVVSFPIISRHLRAYFASSSAVKCCLSSEHSDGDHLQIDVLSQQRKDVDGGLAESAGSLKRKRSDNDLCVAERDDISDPSHSKEELNDGRNSSEAGEKCRDVSPESTNYNTQPLHPLHGGTDNNVVSNGITCASHGTNTNSEGSEENAIPMERKVIDNVEGGETVSTTSADVIIKDSETCENNSVANLGGFSTDDNVISNGITCASHRNNTISDGAEENAIPMERKVIDNVEGMETVSTTSADVIIKDSEACENNSVANLGGFSTDDNVISDGITCASHRNNTISEGAEENAIPMERKVIDNDEGRETVSTTSADVIIKDSEACENNSVAKLGGSCNSHDNSFSQIHSFSADSNLEHNHGNPSDIASCSAANATLTSNQIIETGKEVKSSDLRKLDGAMANDQQTSGVGMALPPANRKEKDDHALGGETVSTTSADVIIKDSEACENNCVANLRGFSNSHDNSFSQIHSLSADINPEYTHGNPSDIASCSAANATLTSNQIIETGKEVKSSDFRKLDVAMANDQQTSGVGMALPPANRKEKADHALGNILKKQMHGKLSEFDPIRQHRIFCPWIAAPEGGESLPGWRLTLDALIQEEKVSSSASQHSDTPVVSTDEVDDAIVSIRKLFMSPATKRFKGAR